MSAPLSLAIMSHRGGVGVTTTVAGLARALAEAGHRVAASDARGPHGALGRLLEAAGVAELERPWPPRPEDLEELDVHLVDAARLGETPGILPRVDGILWVLAADPLNLRTLPGAAALLSEELARSSASLLGLLVNAFDAEAPLQARTLASLLATQPALVVDPPIPAFSEAAPGDPSQGAPSAYGRLAEALAILWRPPSAEREASDEPTRRVVVTTASQAPGGWRGMLRKVSNRFRRRSL